MLFVCSVGMWLVLMRGPGSLGTGYVEVTVLMVSTVTIWILPMVWIIRTLAGPLHLRMTIIREESSERLAPERRRALIRGIPVTFGIALAYAVFVGTGFLLARSQQRG